jgi:hypothetical protein
VHCGVDCGVDCGRRSGLALRGSVMPQIVPVTRGRADT